MADNGFATMAYIKQLIEEKQELQAKLDKAIRCIEFYRNLFTRRFPYHRGQS